MAAIGVLAGLASTARSEVADGIKAVVHDSIITYQQVADYTTPFVAELRRRYGDQPAMFEKRVAEARDTMDRCTPWKILQR